MGLIEEELKWRKSLRKREMIFKIFRKVFWISIGFVIGILLGGLL